MFRFLTLVFVIGGLSLGSSLKAQRSLPEGITLQTLEGEDFALEDLQEAKGPIVLAFWATWCAPCKKELDAYQKTLAEWQSKYGAQVYAVSVDSRRALPKVAPLVADRGWGFPVLSDVEQQLQTALGFQSVPQVFVLDADGKIVYEHAGYSPGDEAEVAEQLEALAGR